MSDLFTDFPEISKNLPEPLSVPKPVFQWAGGKTQLLEVIRSMVTEGVPQGLSGIGTYYEPFLGGGAVLFHFAHSKNVVNDINPFIVNVYQVVRDSPQELMEILDLWDAGPSTEQYYLEKREQFNKVLSDNELGTHAAALFLYINRHCFNALYRVNRSGKFNVGWNKKPNVSSYIQKNIEAVSRFLNDSDTTILNGGYDQAVTSAVAGDFVFLDSPYDEIVTGGFSNYDKSGFKRDDHAKLAQTYKELTARGVYCMATNHGTDLIRDLYAGFDIVEVDVRRAINSNGKNRVGKEVIITNFSEFRK